MIYMLPSVFELLSCKNYYFFLLDTQNILIPLIFQPVILCYLLCFHSSYKFQNLSQSNATCFNTSMCSRGQSSAYFCDACELLVSVASHFRLHSAGHDCAMHTDRRFGPCSFHVLAAHIWNTLPSHL